MGGLYIGTSGFMYRHWRGNFYPDGLAQNRWFIHYSSVFNTVELNVTFYRLPEKRTFEKWHSETPEGFVFSVKGSRYITHVKRLLSTAEPLGLFMDRASALKEKLGVVLWQLPPNFGKDAGRLRGFLKNLRRYKTRNVFEFREESWFEKDIVSLLKEEGHAICSADWPPFADRPPVTSDMAYIRRHGHGGSYDGCYSMKDLKSDARLIRRHLRDGLDVYVYFNNDVRGYAPRNALELKGLLEK